MLADSNFFYISVTYPVDNTVFQNMGFPLGVLIDEAGVFYPQIFYPLYQQAPLGPANQFIKLFFIEFIVERNW